MDPVIARLVLNSTALASEELCVFCYLCANAVASEEQRERDERFRGKIFSTLSYDEICSRYNMLDSTAVRIVKKFESIGWLRLDGDGVVLGEWQGNDGARKKFWYCSKSLGSCKQREPAKETATQQLRRLIAESKRTQVQNKLEKLPWQEKSKILAELKTRKTTTPGSKIFQVAKAEHVKRFGVAYQMAKDLVQGTASFPKEYKCWNIALSYCDNNEDKLQEVVLWVYENWDAVKKQISWLGQYPNVSLFATKSYMGRVLQMRGEEYAQKLTVGNRHDEIAARSAPDRGY